MKAERDTSAEIDMVNPSNALDLSESEDEDDIENLFDDFSLGQQMEDVRQFYH